MIEIGCKIKMQRSGGYKRNIFEWILKLFWVSYLHDEKKCKILNSVWTLLFLVSFTSNFRAKKKQEIQMRTRVTLAFLRASAQSSDFFPGIRKLFWWSWNEVIDCWNVRFLFYWFFKTVLQLSLKIGLKIRITKFCCLYLPIFIDFLKVPERSFRGLVTLDFVK